MICRTRYVFKNPFNSEIKTFPLVFFLVLKTQIYTRSTNYIIKLWIKKQHIWYPTFRKYPMGFVAPTRHIINHYSGPPTQIFPLNLMKNARNIDISTSNTTLIHSLPPLQPGFVCQNICCHIIQTTFFL